MLIKNGAPLRGARTVIYLPDIRNFVGHEVVLL